MKRYTLGIIYDENMENVLLLQRQKDPYVGRYNGIGGKLKRKESRLDGTLREVNEEINLTSDYLTIKPLMSLRFPHHVVMDVFYAILRSDVDKTLIPSENEEGTLHWVPVNEVMNPTNYFLFAGEGNLSYFVSYSLILEGKRQY